MLTNVTALPVTVYNDSQVHKNRLFVRQIGCQVHKFKDHLYYDFKEARGSNEISGIVTNGERDTCKV